MTRNLFPSPTSHSPPDLMSHRRFCLSRYDHLHDTDLSNVCVNESRHMCGGLVRQWSCICGQNNSVFRSQIQLYKIVFTDFLFAPNLRLTTLTRVSYCLVQMHLTSPHTICLCQSPSISCQRDSKFRQLPSCECLSRFPE
jgi:hypothetical protein